MSRKLVLALRFSIRNRIELFEAYDTLTFFNNAICFSIRNRIELFEACAMCGVDVTLDKFQYPQSDRIV